jgi:hypothetical protein
VGTPVAPQIAPSGAIPLPLADVDSSTEVTVDDRLLDPGDILARPSIAWPCCQRFGETPSLVADCDSIRNLV